MSLQRAGDEEILLLQAQLLSLDLLVFGYIRLVMFLRGDFLVTTGAPVVGTLLNTGRSRTTRAPRAPQAAAIGVIDADSRGSALSTARRLTTPPGHPRTPSPALLHRCKRQCGRRTDLRRPTPGAPVHRVAKTQATCPVSLSASLDEFPAENSVFVANAIAHARHLQRRQRIDEAGRQPAEAAVAEPGSSSWRNSSSRSRPSSATAWRAARGCPG